jgi:hypothetical protein
MGRDYYAGVQPGVCDFSQTAPDHIQLVVLSQRACQSLGGTTQTYWLSRYLLQHDVPGVFVECGVFTGTQLGCMACAMQRENKRRPLHGFDSFDGIPCAGPQDDSQPGLGLAFLMDRNLPLEQRLTSSGVSRSTLDQVKAIWAEWHFTDIEIEWHPGWFQHSLPGNTLGPIAFLRLDGDLFESTERCLHHLYDKVSPGGLVFVDDYGPDGCGKAVHEFFERRQFYPTLLADHQGNASAIYWFKA